VMGHNRRQTHTGQTIMTQYFDLDILILAPVPFPGLDKQTSQAQIATDTTLNRQTVFVKQQLKFQWLTNTASVFHLKLPW
jgi:hypothetical protein